ncbi:hypothetical protein BGW36DRAFT_384381 [Talaromyces proteolyticus]|uniref:Uncharacterized protein n=1 Tax=Talaromyces proteolyticus TaxID=1131652 RepID=A0AAD4PY01_9EURO|nr:uncharacterized protein BGW36DRAFT_384381 [Talaromyces proteolyticus]KAH8694105.1 hypothetical protein BGW36DRAFT_384381 [Talaromyces proteolyticus]
MQIAEILSDLTSLRACGHTEALALVNVHKTAESTAEEQGAESSELSRAKELADLHYTVKVKHMKNGPGSDPEVDEGLQHAREDVNQVLRELKSS